MTTTTSHFAHATEALTSATTLLDGPGWPPPLHLLLRSIFDSTEGHLARARARPDDRASLIWAAETVCEARAHLLAIGNRQVSEARYAELRRRLDEMERAVRALARRRGC